MELSQLWAELVKGLAQFTPGHAVMIVVGAALITVAIVKQYEPVLLLPIGFGCILANIPLSGMMVTDENGLFNVLYKAGISTQLFPLFDKLQDKSDHRELANLNSHGGTKIGSEDSNRQQCLFSPVLDAVREG